MDNPYGMIIKNYQYWYRHIHSNNHFIIAVEEGCLEEFENTASFSREYQARQDCMCDSEHMFDCVANRNTNEYSDSDFDRLVQHFHVCTTYNISNC